MAVETHNVLSAVSYVYSIKIRVINISIVTCDQLDVDALFMVSWITEINCCRCHADPVYDEILVNVHVSRSG